MCILISHKCQLIGRHRLPCNRLEEENQSSLIEGTVSNLISGLVCPCELGAMIWLEFIQYSGDVLDKVGCASPVHKVLQDNDQSMSTEKSYLLCMGG